MKYLRLLTVILLFAQLCTVVSPFSGFITAILARSTGNKGTSYLRNSTDIEYISDVWVTDRFLKTETMQIEKC